jgi:trigger factor
MKRDQEKEFKLSFPPDFSQPALAGKEVEFKVKLLEVKEEKLPELNDALAAEIEPQFKTLAELRQRVEENMKLRAEDKAARDFENELIDEAVKISKVAYPPILVEAEIDNLVSRQLQELQRHVSSQEEFNRKLAETPPEKVREAQRPEAEERVIRALVLGKIATEEGLKVDEKEVKAEIDYLTRDITDIDKAEAQKKALNTPENLNQIYNMLLTRKTINLLTERAKGGAKKATPKATTKKATAGETKTKASANSKAKPAAKKTATSAKSKKSAKEAK